MKTPIALVSEVVAGQGLAAVARVLDVPKVRTMSMGGSRHTTAGGCCEHDDRCGRCGARAHMSVCEECPDDAHCWVLLGPGDFEADRILGRSRLTPSAEAE